MKLSPIAAWFNLALMTPEEVADAARRVEELGFSELWYPNAGYQDPLVRASVMLAATQTLRVATGIACIYDYPARTIAAAQRIIYDQSDGRFILGLGLSHPEGALHYGRPAYGSPIPTMRSYLEELDVHIGLGNEALTTAGASPRASLRDPQMPRVIAALGPKMLELAGEFATGAHPYLVTPEHTAEARRLLGPSSWLCVEQKVVLETDPTRARASGRRALSIYMQLSNYLNSWRRLGFDDDDFTGGGSDRLVDALVAWGDVGAIRRRLDDHLAAGATQVCVQPLAAIDADEFEVPWETLAAVSDIYGLKAASLR